MDRVALHKARIVYYGLFSSLFSFSLTEEHFEIISRSVDLLSENPIDERSARALTHLKRRLKTGGYKSLKMESDRVFYSPATPIVPMTASYFFEQRDDGSKRMEMMGYVLQSKFRRNTNEYKEHEDHIEFILLFIQKLITEELLGDKTSEDLSKKVFKNVLNRMIDDFSSSLLSHEKSVLYKYVAVILRSFFDLERLYLNIVKPTKKGQERLAKPNIIKDKEPSKEINMVTHSGCV